MAVQESFRDPLRRTGPDTASCFGVTQGVPEGWGFGEGATEFSRRRARKCCGDSRCTPRPPAAPGRHNREERLALIYEPMVDGVEGQLEPVRNPELVENVMEVVFDGLFADEELFPDFLVPIALSDQLDDFLLAVAEQGLFAARAAVGGLGKGQIGRASCRERV